MKPCEIAVIVPVHNAAAFLTACTDAIAAQKFDGFRCILVEDGSTDGSPALCDAIAAGDQRFVALHQTNSGVCAARTAGVREGRALGAKWFAFCDADDLYHPEFLDTLYAAVTNSGLPLACCRYDTFTDTVPADAPAPCNSKILRSPAHLDALLHDHAVDYGLWNKLFSADLLTEEMLDNGLAYNEDLLANWRAFLVAPGCAFCDFAGYHYRQHAASASHRALPPQSIDDQRRAALGGFTQGGFGRLHRGIGGSVVLGRVAVGAGKSLDALPQQGVGAVVQAGLLGRQGDGCPAGQGGRLAVFVNRGRKGIGTVVHRHREGHRLVAGLAATGAQAYRQRQGQDQRNEFFHGIRETP